MKSKSKFAKIYSVYKTENISGGFKGYFEYYVNIDGVEQYKAYYLDDCIVYCEENDLDYEIINDN